MRKNAKRGNELMNRYLGHLSQLYGVEEHRLVGGKGDGMRLFEIRNGRGLELTVSADRCADIARLTFKGDNMGYFAPSGYVSPAYYDREGDGFLKSFTAGFLATCGLTTVGPPDEDDGEQLPMHGTIGNCPAESIYAVTDEDAIRLHAVINPSSLFGEKLVLYREIICSLDRNCFEIVDTVRNEGDKISPLMILYHMNMGYPLLDENAELLSEDKVGRLIHLGNIREVQNAIFKSFYRGTAGDNSDTENENDGEETTEEGNRAAVQEN